MLWKVTDDWTDKEIKAKGISMEKRRDFAWDLITEYVAHDIATQFEVSDRIMGWGQTCLLQFAEFWGLELCFTYARSSMDERQPRMIRWDGKAWALMISERNKEN